jgi:hypothetical protein
MVSFFIYLISAKNKINNKFFSQVGHTNNLLKWLKKIMMSWVEYTKNKKRELIIL